MSFLKKLLSAAVAMAAIASSASADDQIIFHGTYKGVRTTLATKTLEKAGATHTIDTISVIQSVVTVSGLDYDQDGYLEIVQACIERGCDYYVAMTQNGTRVWVRAADAVWKYFPSEFEAREVARALEGALKEIQAEPATVVAGRN